MDALGVDEAYLRLAAAGETDLYFYGLSADCQRCPYQRMSAYPIHQDHDNTLFTLSTRRPWSFLFVNVNATYFDPANTNYNQSHCSLENISLGEFGVYEVTVSPAACSIST
ncbi:uncharacterized protein LOC108683219, partial [Hyalella azteca]|uniref:Uncharacterized protein LOC108683219 n=1 Tax=Hyalella azteca TaxID=294128 RepID=A0A8B7PP73_HYAAZ